MSDPTQLRPDGRVWILVESSPLSTSDAGAFVATPASGAAVVFSGMVRDHAPGRADVSRLEYEVYEEEVFGKIQEVVDQAMAQWPLHKAAVFHRVGSLEVGEVSVVVAVSSAHRVDAFVGAKFVIDEIKKRAPIWKKEHWEGGAEWVREDVERGG